MPNAHFRPNAPLVTTAAMSPFTPMNPFYKSCGNVSPPHKVGLNYESESGSNMPWLRLVPGRAIGLVIVPCAKIYSTYVVWPSSIISTSSLACPNPPQPLRTRYCSGTLGQLCLEKERPLQMLLFRQTAVQTQDSCHKRLVHLLHRY